MHEWYFLLFSFFFSFLYFMTILWIYVLNLVQPESENTDKMESWELIKKKKLDPSQKV
jgi:hypothetical protein